MARQLGPFDWQARLEREGSVTFGPSRWSSGVLFAVAIAGLIGFLVELVVDGPALWSVFGTLVLVACALSTGRAALQGAAQLTVTHEGFRMGRALVVPFARLGAVSVSRRNLVLHYAGASAGQQSGRTPNQKRLVVTLPFFHSYHPDDLAVWLLKLARGPSADVVVDPDAGLHRVFRVRS